MAEDKKDDKKGEKVETGFVIVEFLKDHGGRKKGDKETYHVSTAKALTNAKKGGVAKVIEKLTKYVPKKAIA